MAYSTTLTGYVYGGSSNNTVSLSNGGTNPTTVTDSNAAVTQFNVCDTVTFSTTRSNGSTFSFTGTYQGDYTDGNGVSYPVVSQNGQPYYYVVGQTDYNGTYPYTATSYPPCYATGTLILTDRGQIAVEDLRVGDMAVTASGAIRPIRWLGHRRTDCRNHSRPAEVMPIRIAAHAFGPDKPSRDLYVSPGHSICVTMIEEVLIPASSLVNGTTIQQVEVEEVTYWHVELDSHDILLAENLPAESYLNVGNRGFFLEANVVELNASPDASLKARTHADFCRPFHSEGQLVDAVRSYLCSRRATLGWTLQHEPLADLHLIADGVRIEPAIRDLTARFSLPAGARDVWLVSTTSRPCEISDSIDSRDLGVCVSGLTIDDGFGTGRAIALDDPLLCIGFHHVEDGIRRWMAGHARIPAALWNDCPDGFFLCVQLGAPALPRWAAPAAVLSAKTTSSSFLRLRAVSPRVYASHSRLPSPNGRKRL